MQRWLISVPAWGERCVDVFCATALPALENAILHLEQQVDGVDPHVVVHTDQPERMKQSATQIKIETYPVPSGLRDFDCMSQAHREAMRMGCIGDIVVLLTADLVMPRGCLSFAAEYLSNPQKKLLMCASIRALQEGQLPNGLSGEELMKWAWDNQHPMTTECTWPDGKSGDLSRIYFAKDQTVNTRLCLPHPLAYKVDGRPLTFSPTIDANLMQCWEPSEMALAKDATKVGLVELSPRDKDFQIGQHGVASRVEDGAMRVSDRKQQWCYNHPVRLFGPVQDCGDTGVASTVIGNEARIREVEAEQQEEAAVK